MHPLREYTNMELYYREFGQGNPVLILHGLFGFSDNWQTVAKALADHHLVLTPDLRNHGKSPHTDSHSYPEMAEDIKEFMEQHWMFSGQLIGHSMGGKTAMQFALHHPDMVDRLVVVDIAPQAAEDKHSHIYKAMLSLDFDALADRKEIDAQLAQHIPELGIRQFLLKNITRDKEGRFQWKMNLPVLWENYDRILEGIQPPAGTVFDKPTLFVRGSLSSYVKDEDMPYIQSLFPQAELKTIQGASHWVHADKPNELLDILNEFLER